MQSIVILIGYMIRLGNLDKVPLESVFQKRKRNFEQSTEN